MGAMMAIPMKSYSSGDIPHDRALSAENVVAGSAASLSANVTAPTTATRKSTSSDSKWNRIEVREAVPPHLANLSELCSWRAMVRQLAFEKMYHHVSTKQTFTAKCQLFEEREPNPFGAGERVVIRCVLKYKIDNDS